MNLKEKKKGNLKKIAAATSICLAVAAPMVLTGCSESEIDVGTKWLTGIEAPTSSSGKIGDFYLDTDDFNIYQKDKEGWKLIGCVKGEDAQGQQGEKGVGIASITKTASVGSVDTYTITFTDNTVLPATFTVTNGTNGVDGLTPYIGENGNWWIGTGNEARDLNVRANGDAGLSAYQLFKLENPTSTLTQAEWLESLKGADGKSAYDIWKAANPTSTLTQAEWMESLNGENGKSAYDLWKEQNPNSLLTQEQWIASLKGEQGVGVLRVESEYGFATSGQQCIYFTIYYTNGTSEVITAMVPRKIQNIEVKNTDIFTLSESATDDVETGIVLKVRYEDSDDIDIVPVTKGMISGIDDYTVPGQHQVEIRYQDQLIEYVNVNIDLNLDEMTRIGSFAAGQSLQFVSGISSIDIYEEGWAVVNMSGMFRSMGNRSYCRWEAIAETPTETKTTIAMQSDDIGELVLDLNIDSENEENNAVDMYQPEETPEATYAGNYYSMNCFVKVYEDGLTHPIYNVEAEVQPGQFMLVSSGKFEPTTRNGKKCIIYDGMIGYLNDTEGTFELIESVAYVEGSYFDNFNEAVEYAIENDKVLKLETNIEVSETITVAGDLTIDLNYCTITTTHAGALFKHTSGNFVVNNGCLITKGETFFVDTNADEDEDAIAELYLGEYLQIRSENNCVYVRGKGASLVTYADMETSSTGVEVATIQGNGLLKNRIEKIHIAGGRVVNNGGYEAIYAPQTGKVIVDNGAHIEGGVAIYLKSGNITINGGYFKATGERKDYEYFGNGSVLTGDALVIDACGYPGGNPTVTIIDGIFESENGCGIGYYTYGDNKAVINNYSDTMINFRDEYVEPQPTFGAELMSIDVNAGVEIGLYLNGEYNSVGNYIFTSMDSGYNTIGLNPNEIFDSESYVLRYAFRNDSQNAFEVIKNREYIQENITIKYALSTQALEDLSSLVFADEFEAFDVTSETIYLYVQVEIKDKTQPSNIDGMQGYLLQPTSQEVNVVLNQEFGTSVGLGISELQEKVYNKIQNASDGQKEFYTIETLKFEKGIILENYYTKFATLSDIKNFKGIRIEDVEFIDQGLGFEYIQMSVGNNVHINTLPVIFNAETGDLYIATIILATEMMTSDKITIIYNGLRTYDIELPTQQTELLTINPIVNNNTIIEEDGKYVIVGNEKNTQLKFDFEGNTNTSRSVLAVTKKLNYINNGEFERVGYGFTLTDASVGDGRYSVGIYPAYGKDFTNPEIVEEYEGRQIVYTAYIHEFGVVHAIIEFDPNRSV